MIDGGWKYAASSVIGTSHQNKSGGVCQDSHCSEYLRSPLAVMVTVVSDGAGSATYSHHGSRRTCQYVAARISQAEHSSLFASRFASDVLRGLREDLSDAANEAGITLREYACTLLVAIVGEDRAAFWQVGDGAMCFRIGGTDNYQYAFWPEKGDYANVTFFVTDPAAEQHLEFDVTEGKIVELAAFTDGLERLALDFAAGEAHPGFFKGLFPHLLSMEPGHSTDLSLQLTNFLTSERVNKRTDDDKTLVLASRAQ